MKPSNYCFNDLNDHSLLRLIDFYQSYGPLSISAIFSSPEHEVLMVSYCDQSLSVVRRLSSTICFKS